VVGVGAVEGCGEEGGGGGVAGEGGSGGLAVRAQPPTGGGAVRGAALYQLLQKLRRSDVPKMKKCMEEYVDEVLVWQEVFR